jgi:drug/metabolite transporter (DMT)-like permease
MDGHRTEAAGLAMGLGAILLWGASATAVLWAGRELGPWQYLAIGNFIAFAGQVVAYRSMGRNLRSLWALPPRLWAVALLGFVFYSACYAVGLVSAKSDAQAVGVGLMNHTWPVLTVVLAVFLVPGTRWSARLGVALALALTGLLFANGDALARARGDASVLPYVLGGLAGISWALYSALIARWRSWASAYATAPAGFFLVSLLGAAVCWARGDWRPVSPRTWLVLLFQGLGPNAIGYLLWELALHRAPATTLGLLGAATPVLSTLCLFAFAALTSPGHSLPARWGLLLLGAAFIALAVVLNSLYDARAGRQTGQRTTP